MDEWLYDFVDVYIWDIWLMVVDLFEEQYLFVIKEGKFFVIGIFGICVIDLWC